MKTTHRGMFVNEQEELNMDWNFAGMVLSLFLLGVAYGAIAELYIDMVRFYRNRHK